MIFPISVRYDRQLRSIITSYNQAEILNYIKKSILIDHADNVVIGDLKVTYKGSTSYWNTSKFRSVDDGIFTLVNKGGNWSLNYQINMPQLFIVTSIMSTVVTVFMLVDDGPWWAGIFAFLWLCGMNWIVNFVRHEAVATSIAEGIDELICGKVELPEKEDKMTGKLKHWM